MLTEDEGVEFLRLARPQIRRRLPGVSVEERDDVLSTAILRATKAPAYDRRKGSFTTWVRIFVERAIGDENVAKRRGVATALDEMAEAAYYARWISINRLLLAEDDYERVTLTDVERDTLQAFTTRETYEEVADLMGVTRRTVDARVSSAYAKLGVSRLHRALIVAAARYEIVL